MSERFYCSSPIVSDRAELAGEEARHLASVMRAKVGDEVVLFDGRGAEFLARVSAIRKQSVELAIAIRREISRELPFSLALAVALPKGERQKWLVEKATELGVTCLVPLVTERGVAQPVEAAIDRLRRSVIEASKQCGRNRLMEIAAPQSVTMLFGEPATTDLRLIATASGEPIVPPAIGAGGSAMIAIGPEGGFSPSELTVAAAGGWKAVSLGNRVLRVETAAIALAAWLALDASSFLDRR